MGKNIHNNQQVDLFDKGTNRWQRLAVGSHNNVEQILTQLLIKAIQQSSVIQKKEDVHASENKVEPF